MGLPPALDTLHDSTTGVWQGLSLGMGDIDPMNVSLAALLIEGGRHDASKVGEKLALEIAKKLTSGDRSAYMQVITKIDDNPQLLAAVRAIQIPATVAGAQ